MYKPLLIAEHTLIATITTKNKPKTPTCNADNLDASLSDNICQIDFQAAGEFKCVSSC